jgi:organic radical activating enzyme
LAIILSNDIGDNFCFAPWTNIHITIDGLYKTCCSGSILLGTIQNDDINNVVTSDKLKLIKTALINNKYHQNCQGCYALEKQGSQSERQWYSTIPIILNDINDHADHSIDIRWNNVCNLSCTYCNKDFSSTWAKLENSSITKFYSKSNNQLIYDYINKHKNTIKEIKLAGGEPLMIKENIKLFEIIDGSDIKLYIISNFASPAKENPVFQKLLSISNDFQLDVSFETLGNKFEYVRRGANWTTLLENFNYARDMITKNKLNSNISIASLYTIYNALDLSHFIEFLHTNNLPMPRFTSLSTPKELSVFNLPDSYRDRCISELLKSKDIFSNQPQDFFIETINIIKLTNSKNINTEYLINWHERQENKYWPNNQGGFVSLWPEFN